MADAAGERQVQPAKGALARALDVVGLPLLREWHVVHLASKRLSPVATACRDFILDEGPRLLASPEWGGAAGRPGRKAPKGLK